ncbi:hypothetical protein BU17DRAFT_70945 [Hysterangium stoloniferum]|nr:hypothetical protein BU17DRAFT_70945 [Hysterangium stoloniferum]
MYPYLSDVLYVWSLMAGHIAMHNKISHIWYLSLTPVGSLIGRPEIQVDSTKQLIEWVANPEDDKRLLLQPDAELADSAFDRLRLIKPLLRTLKAPVPPVWFTSTANIPTSKSHGHITLLALWLTVATLIPPIHGSSTLLHFFGPFSACVKLTHRGAEEDQSSAARVWRVMAGLLGFAKEHPTAISRATSVAMGITTTKTDMEIVMGIRAWTQSRILDQARSFQDSYRPPPVTRSTPEAFTAVAGVQSSSTVKQSPPPRCSTTSKSLIGLGGGAKRDGIRLGPLNMGPVAVGELTVINGRREVPEGDVMWNRRGLGCVERDGSGFCGDAEYLEGTSALLAIVSRKKLGTGPIRGTRFVGAYVGFTFTHFWVMCGNMLLKSWLVIQPSYFHAWQQQPSQGIFTDTTTYYSVPYRDTLCEDASVDDDTRSDSVPGGRACKAVRSGESSGTCLCGTLRALALGCDERCSGGSAEGA